MLDVTVKTLNGKNHTFGVPDEITVKEFKEKIAATIEITVENQRLIFLGRVLQDDKKLQDYDVHGKTMHVVARPPPSMRAEAAASASATPAGDNTRHPRRRHNQDGNQLMSTIQQAISRGMGEAGRNAQVSTSQSADGSSLDVHINLGQIGELPSESQRRIDTARRMIQRANRTITRLEAGPPERRERNATGSNTTGSSATNDTAQVDTEDSDMETEQSQADADVSVESGVGESHMVMVEEITEIQMEAQVHIRTGSDEEADAQIDARMDASTQNAQDSQMDDTTDSDTHTPASSDSMHTQVPGSTSTSTQQASSRIQTDSSGETSTQTDDTNTSATGTQTEGTNAVQHPAPSAMADLMTEVMTLNRRLQPHMEHYTELMRNDPSFGDDTAEVRRELRAFNLTSEAMHYVSHAYHAISDVMIDLRRPPPRQLRAGPTPAPSMMPRPFLLPQAIPVQATVGAHLAGANQPAPTATSGSTATSQTGPRPTVASTQARPSSAPRMANYRPLLMNMATGSVPNLQTGSTGVPPNAPPPMMHGLPPFMDPNMFQNFIQMATGSANMAPGSGPRVRSQVFVVTQPGGTPVRVTPPVNSTAGSRPSTPQASNQPRTGQNQPRTGQNQPRPFRWTVSGGHVRPTAGASSTSNNNNLGARPRTDAAHPIQFMPMPLPPDVVLPQALNLQSRVDPFLPCHSRHFLARRAALAARHGNQQTGNGQQQQAGNQSAESTIASVVSNIVGGLMSQADGGQNATNAQNTSVPTTNANPAAGNLPATNPFAALFGGSVNAPLPTGGAPNAGSGAPQAGGVPNWSNFVQQLGTMFSQQTVAPGQSGSSTTSSTASQSASSGSRQAPAGPGTSDQVVGELLRGVSNALAQASATGENQGSIGDFLQQLSDQYNISASSEGFLNGILHCISQNMGFADLLQVFFGNAQPLQNLRTPLQNFLRERILSGNSASAENIERGVSQLVTECTDQLESSTSNVQTLDDIDFESTLTTFMEHNLTVLVTYIMNSDEADTTFGADLHATIKRLIQQFIVLGDHCLGPQGFNAFVSARVNEFNSDINPAMMSMMSNMMLTHLQTVRDNVTITHNDITHYVIKKSAHKMDTSSQKSHSSENDETEFLSADEGETPPSTSRVEEVTSCKAVNGQTTEPASSPKVASEPDDIAQSPANRGVPFPLETENGCWHDCGPEYSAARTAPSRSEMALHASRCDLAPANQTAPPDVALGSDHWHAVVPSEWVPVISRDIETQQKKEQGRPLSDAYITGMPSKRRKVIHENRPDSSAFAQPESSLPENLIHTATAMGIQPITSRAELSHDLATNENLNAAFHSQVREDVRRRCKDETDFVPHKYKNTEKYFGNKK